MNKMIVMCVAAMACVLWASIASAAPGDLDPSFGAGGKVFVPAPVQMTTGPFAATGS